MISIFSSFKRLLRQRIPWRDTYEDNVRYALNTCGTLWAQNSLYRIYSFKLTNGRLFGPIVAPIQDRFKFISHSLCIVQRTWRQCNYEKHVMQIVKNTGNVWWKTNITIVVSELKCWHWITQTHLSCYGVVPFVRSCFGGAVLLFVKHNFQAI